MPRRSGLLVGSILALLVASSAARAGTLSVARIENPAPSADAAFGMSVAGLGDVDGDGCDDLAVGAPGADIAYILSGCAPFDVIHAIPDPDGESGNNFGFAVAAVGDLDSDGAPDLVVGAPGDFMSLPLPCPLEPPECPPPSPVYGRAFAFSGSTGSLIRTFTPAGAEGFVEFGFAVTGLGDVTGDGRPDVGISAPIHHLRSWGEVYAFSGADAAQLWRTREPPYPDERQAIPSFGRYIASIADLDGDGRRDLIVAAPLHDIDPDPDDFQLAGRTHVLSGDDGALLRIDENPPPVGSSDFFGGRVAPVGDQDGDGHEDYGAGDRGENVVQILSGDDGSVIRPIPVGADEAEAGLFALADAGDRDGDALDDIWIGAPLTGKVILVAGSTGATLAEAVGMGSIAGGFGHDISATGDLDGDGAPDLVAGEPAAAGPTGETGSGAAHVVAYIPNRPPVADAGTDQTVSADGDCLGPVTLDASGSSDPDGDDLVFNWTGPFGAATGPMPTVTLPLGTHTITLTVEDESGETDSDTVMVTVEDTTGPTITSAAANPDHLWPPDHRFVSVTVAIAAVDNCDASPSCGIVSVASNEPVDGSGDGDSGPDWAILGSAALMLRAERSGVGTGRVYAVAASCIDDSLNGSQATATVTVPRARP